MPQQPAVVIIARHGARLDADPRWHLTSPTPYDPPLTYGGWTQSRALGLRIASLLQARDAAAPGDEVTVTQGDTDGNGNASQLKIDNKTRKKKYKVIIHSSPFLRCIQTSIGISAGLAQFENMGAGKARNDSRARMTGEATSSPRVHAVDASAASVAAKSSLRKALKDGSLLSKTTLRIDAYLGEWLSPDYFDLITPPPNSTMMVAGAKADLLRRGDDVDTFSLSPSLANKASQGSLWSNTREPTSSGTSTPDGPLDMKSLSQALPARDRTASYSSGRVSPFGRPVVAKVLSTDAPAQAGYHPPTPGYAISPLEPIPKGYVAHARDACVDIDYQWDSMREPLSWGDGGEYGEEWSAMHKRFRRGFGHAINWYSEHPDGHQPDEHEAVPAGDGHGDSDMEDELVLVLVTHGAGCNALVGALTEQPVLIDVGMASMTMAVRRDKSTANGSTDGSSEVKLEDAKASSTQRGSWAGTSISTGLSDRYEMKMIASTEHLRPGTDPSRPSSPAATSPGLAGNKTIPDARRRSTLLSHAAAGSPLDATWIVPESHRGNTSTALGSIRRLSTQNMGVPVRSGSVSSVTSSAGLWMPSTPPLTEASKEKETGEKDDKRDSPARDMVLNFNEAATTANNDLGISFAAAGASTMKPPPAPVRSKTDDLSAAANGPAMTSSPLKEETDSVSELPKVPAQVPSTLGRTLSQKGLWGSAPSGVQQRDSTPKRRWTVSQD